MTSKHALVDNSVKLFTYLARLQELKEKRVADIESYKDDGKVIWFNSLPQHDAVNVIDEVTGEDPFLTVSRIDAAEPLTPPAEVQEVLDGPWDDPTHRPVIPSQASAELKDQASMWLETWDTWAETEQRNRPVRKLYDDLFQVRRDIEKASETYELILGFGLLSWSPNEQDRVRRHLFTVSIEINFDDMSGDVTVSLTDAQGVIRPELNMLDPGLYDAALPSRMQSLTEDIDPVTISAEVSELIGVPAANLLATNGAYADTQTVPEPPVHPLVTYSPAIIMRKKGQRSFTTAFDRIAEQIAASGEMPPGLVPMVDPDQPPMATPDSRPGALIEANENEIFSPLPLNKEQERVLKRVDSHAQTVVQGPPGTGKTHTAAALITHLLAQGKRILVTAYTERALYEVRGKLPAEIRDLAVSAIGQSAAEMAELKGSITRIASAAEDFDRDENQAREQEECQRISELLSRREKYTKKLVDALQDEAKMRHLGTYQGTKAELIRRHSADADSHRWILLGDGPKRTKSPLLNEEAVLLLDLLRDEELSLAVAELDRTPDTLPDLLSASDFAGAVNVLRQLEDSETTPEVPEVKHLARSLPDLPRDTAYEIGERLTGLLHRMRTIDSTGMEWRSNALREVIAGSTEHWTMMVENLASSVRDAHEALSVLGTAEIEPTEGLNSFAPQATQLHDHVASGKTIALKSDGTAKIGFLASSTVKNCASLLTTVRVNGRVPTTAEDFSSILARIHFDDVLVQAERVASVIRPLPPLLSPHQRLAELQKTIELLEPAVSLGCDISDFNREMGTFRMPPVPWQSAGAAQNYVDALYRHLHFKDIDAAREPFDTLISDLRQLSQQHPELPRWVADLTRAVEERDATGYSQALERQGALDQLRSHAGRRTALLSRLAEWHPPMARSLENTPGDPEWDDRCASLQEAADWLRLGRSIEERHSLDVNGIQDKIRTIDDQLHKSAGKVAKLRAWREAVNRLTPTARGRLTDYVQQTRRLGKGTGKYAPEQRAAVRRALDECRDYVPVWIMPLGRVVDQVSLRENAFDVIIVDEASQAGMEATFLQYLAPRIVVIGDDKQVSPSAIGVTISEINNLADQYLSTLPFKDALANPERSFFDDAVMRFSGQITLKEHRRCVPEIINFSNLIAYEPEDIRLEPVRQVGRDRLDPFKVVYAEGGVAQGTGDGQYNEVEAQAVVDLIVTCLEDPRYDGLSLGVISLTGKGQVKKIQQLLQRRISPKIIEERDLMVGNAPDFQGAERDVMFLTMVASLNGQRRVTALTRELFVQRYNVAVSRAKDQVWVIHSLRRSDVHTPGDMRHELLDYAYSVAANTTRGLEASLPVDENNLVAPFDSLFEQRVHNRIVARGYAVTPQVPVIGYKIDLVVEGVDQKLAVECDGDHWHSGEAIKKDMARQRNLERVGWTVFRVRESDFYADGAAALEPLWKLLEDKGIGPGDATAEKDETTSGNFYRVTDDRTIEQLSEPGDTPEGNDAAVLDVIDATRQVIGAVESDPYDFGKAQSTVDTGSSDTSSWSGDYYVSPAGAVYEPDQPTVVLEELRHDRFTSFDGVLPRVADASDGELTNGLLAILRVEGPARGDQVIDTYVRASGGRRGKGIVQKLQGTLASAKRRGLILEDNPSNERAVLRRTFRLPDQSEVHVRSLGSRDIRDVPDRELLTVATHYASGSRNEDEVLRDTMHFYGVRKLTTRVRDILLPTVQKAMGNR